MLTQTHHFPMTHEKRERKAETRRTGNHKTKNRSVTTSKKLVPEVLDVSSLPTYQTVLSYHDTCSLIHMHIPRSKRSSMLSKLGDKASWKKEVIKVKVLFVLFVSP